MGFDQMDQPAGAGGFWRRLRLRGRAFLFGRVYGGMFLWLGVALLLAIVLLGLLGLGSLMGGHQRKLVDQGAEMLIRR